MTNNYPGLSRGPLNHKSTSVINLISGASHSMGDVVILATAITAGELIPRTAAVGGQGVTSIGVVCGGDVDGIYGTGAAASDDTQRASNAAGQGVEVCTQGLCLARVTGTIAVGDPLTPSATVGALEAGTTADLIVARAMQPSTTADISLVNVQQEGIF